MSLQVNDEQYIEVVVENDLDTIENDLDTIHDP